MIQQEVLPEISEQYIIDVLASKHTQDLFVPHCKVGPSYGFSNISYCACGRIHRNSNLLILDAWVMPYSWVKPIIGYEIKVSRQDFKRDKKWARYLEFCNLFYFVVPWGLIDVKEIPEEAGLVYLTKSQTSLRYIKRPPIRWWHQIPPSIFQYVLMWRKNELKEKS